MAILRQALGAVLRRRRMEQGRTLRDVAATGRVSLGYLSEVERGQKEASSELLAAICSALGVPLSDVLRELSDEVAVLEAMSTLGSNLGSNLGSTLGANLGPALGERLDDETVVTHVEHGVVAAA
jgi:transcriptional regulator with XRE-family HTH domain